jgi:hypothetical protein
MTLIKVKDRHISTRKLYSPFLFNRTGDYEIVTLPKGQKTNNMFFQECALELLAELSDPQRGGSTVFGKRRVQQSGASASSSGFSTM